MFIFHMTWQSGGSFFHFQATVRLLVCSSLGGRVCCWPGIQELHRNAGNPTGKCLVLAPFVCCT